MHFALDQFSPCAFLNKAVKFTPKMTILGNIRRAMSEFDKV